MHLQLVLGCALFLTTTALPQRSGFEEPESEQVRQFQENRGYLSTIASFRPTTSSYEDFDSNGDNAVSSSQAIPARTSSYGEDNYSIRNAIQLVQQRPQVRTVVQPQQFRRPQTVPQNFKQQLDDEDKKELEEKEEEEPDRLSVLLPQSKFECVGKNTGYYADEGLGCEVFHYCQDNAKHSWVCPDGFTFHQVHLICMPPGNDNICDQSSQYHFVNEYLYKPLNLEEHQNKPNISLRYSDRYYPDSYNYQRDYSDEDNEGSHVKQSVKQIFQHAPAPNRVIQVQRRPSPTPFTPTIRSDTVAQVFRSPEEVNISLQQRRPPYVTQRYVTTEEQDY